MSHYLIVPTEDVDSTKGREGCETDVPRYSLDESQAILKFTLAVDGSITHTQALELMSTSAWSPPPEIPQ